MPRSGIARSYGSCMYRFPRYLLTDLHSGCRAGGSSGPHWAQVQVWRSVDCELSYLVLLYTLLVLFQYILLPPPPQEDVVYIYTMEYHLDIKKNKIMPFAATWMDLETLILSEISQKEKAKYHMISLISGI